MKKARIMQVLALAVAAGVLFTGCSAEKEETRKTRKTKETTEETEDPDDTDDTEDTENTDDTTGNSDSSETLLPLKPDDPTDPTADPSADADEAMKLYEEFIAGDLEVTLRDNCDSTDYLCISNALSAGEKYTEKEIEAMIVAADEYGELKCTDPCEFAYIDCGSDGVPELYANLYFSPGSSSELFILHLVIKAVDGELVTCYAADSWSRCYTDIDENGMITRGGSSGAAVHNTDYAYIDANGDYHYYYGVTVNMYPNMEYVYLGPDDYLWLDFSALDLENFVLECYYFEEDYFTRENYYTYHFFDGDKDVTDPSDFEDGNPYKDVFNETGVLVYTPDEIQKLMDEKAKEINYPG